jgi:hypothetical protein
VSTDVDKYVTELQRLLGSSAAAESVIREARGHLDDKVAALVREGRTPSDAAREAVLAFGDAREFAFAAIASGSLDAAPPAFLRWAMFAGTALTGLLAAFLFIALVGTALFGGEGESTVALGIVGTAAAAILLHAVAFGHVLLRRRQRRLIRMAVFLGGIGLLAVSGAAFVAAGLDDSPGGQLAGLLLAAQGAAAVLTVAFPQLVPQRPLRA